jgi:hypothetical protein
MKCKLPKLAWHKEQFLVFPPPGANAAEAGKWLPFTNMLT